VIGSYLGLDFVTEGRSLVLHGKTGRGKTHLAVAIGYRAIQNGFETLFTTAAELIEDLSNASRRGHLQESLATYTHPHVLVIDEVGYLTYGPDAANVLFHVVNHRHLKKRPMIFTTNKPLNEWGKVLHDEDMAAAILDRVLERGRFIHLDGPSGRTRHLNLGETLPADTKRLRISGIGGSEFPEPTTLCAWLSSLTDWPPIFKGTLNFLEPFVKSFMEMVFVGPAKVLFPSLRVCFRNGQSHFRPRCFSVEFLVEHVLERVREGDSLSRETLAQASRHWLSVQHESKHYFNTLGTSLQMNSRFKAIL